MGHTDPSAGHAAAELRRWSGPDEVLKRRVLAGTFRLESVRQLRTSSGESCMRLCLGFWSRSTQAGGTQCGYLVEHDRLPAHLFEHGVVLPTDQSAVIDAGAFRLRKIRDVMCLGPRQGRITARVGTAFVPGEHGEALLFGEQPVLIGIRDDRLRLRQQHQDGFGFGVEPPVGDRGRDRVAVAGVRRCRCRRRTRRRSRSARGWWRSRSRSAACRRSRES